MSEDREVIQRMIDKAVDAERERCATVAEEWIAMFGEYRPVTVSPQQWATDGVRDIVEAIRQGKHQ